VSVSLQRRRNIPPRNPVPCFALIEAGENAIELYNNRILARFSQQARLDRQAEPVMRQHQGM
jgi:hypothetical protein